MKILIKEVEIEVPKGYVIDEKESDLEHIVFRKALTYHDVMEYIESLPGHISRPLGALPNEEALKKAVAYINAINIAEYYNRGWKPNWKDTAQDKYTIARNGSLFVSMQLIPSGGICFKNKADAEEAIKNFTEIFEAITK